MVPYHTQIYCDKFQDAKIDFFDIIEKSLILCVLEMLALVITLMTVSIFLYLFLKNISPYRTIYLHTGNNV